MKDYLMMGMIMVVSGTLSTMSVWADKLDDIRITLNDLYMISLMTGWMFFFMGVVYGDRMPLLWGALLVAGSLWCIRNQFMITPSQYSQGMIPHHSMAVLMSRRLIEKEPNDRMKEFAQTVIRQQESEIEFLKKV